MCPAKLDPAVSLLDQVLWSYELNRSVDFFNQRVDLLAYGFVCCKRLCEGLHVLDGLVISIKALEVLNPGVAEDCHCLLFSHILVASSVVRSLLSCAVKIGLRCCREH